MSQFTTPLIVEHLDDGRRWRLHEPFEYHVGTYPSKSIIIAPENFITDFASIPRVFWPIVHPTGRYGKAAVIHDLLYGHHFLVRGDRKWADDIFKEGMQVLGVPDWKVTVMYQAVRMFGQDAWDKGKNNV